MSMIQSFGTHLLGNVDLDRVGAQYGPAQRGAVLGEQREVEIRLPQHIAKRELQE